MTFSSYYVWFGIPNRVLPNAGCTHVWNLGDMLPVGILAGEMLAYLSVSPDEGRTCKQLYQYHSTPSLVERSRTHYTCILIPGGLVQVPEFFHMTMLRQLRQTHNQVREIFGRFLFSLLLFTWNMWYYAWNHNNAIAEFVFFRQSFAGMAWGVNHKRVFGCFSREMFLAEKRVCLRVNWKRQRLNISFVEIYFLLKRTCCVSKSINRQKTFPQ